MWKKILVALDRSPLSPIVFEKALETAQATGSRLMLLHVLKWEHEKQYTASHPYVGDVVHRAPCSVLVVQGVSLSDEDIHPVATEKRCDE